MSYWFATRLIARNAKGPDMIVYSQTGKIHWTIQVKASKTKRFSVNLGRSKQNFEMSQFAVLCLDLCKSPDLFIAKTTKFWKHSAASNPLLKVKRGGNYITMQGYSQFKGNFKSLGDPYDT